MIERTQHQRYAQKNTNTQTRTNTNIHTQSTADGASFANCGGIVWLVINFVLTHEAHTHALTEKGIKSGAFGPFSRYFSGQSKKKRLFCRKASVGYWMTTNGVCRVIIIIFWMLSTIPNLIINR